MVKNGLIVGRYEWNSGLTQGDRAGKWQTAYGKRSLDTARHEK